MKKFEGIINGKFYTDESEFRKAISNLDLEDNNDTYVSYRYVSAVDDVKCDSKSIESDINKECDNIVSENEYVKHVVDNSGLDAELIEKLKRASNKSDININVSKRIGDFDKKISDNLIFINELKNNYKKLEEKIKIIDNQIKTLDNANNNYYLNKEYYTNIKDLISVEDAPEVKEESCCVCDCGGCEYDENNKVLSIKDIYDMTPQELSKYFKKNKMDTLADLVDFFIKKC
jgi:cell division FtsZ-interacting protein ZapD